MIFHTHMCLIHSETGHCQCPRTAQAFAKDGAAAAGNDTGRFRLYLVGTYNVRPRSHTYVAYVG